MKERYRELREKVQKEGAQLQQVKWRAEAFEEQRQVYKRLLAELRDQKIQQVRSYVYSNMRDKVQCIREFSVLREKNYYILKLKVEKEEKCYIEGIKEVIRKKERRMEQIFREKDAILEEFQKIFRVIRRNTERVLVNSGFSGLVLRVGRQGGGY